MEEKIISKHKGLSYSIVSDMRNYFEDSLFSTYPFLNTLCIKEFYEKENTDKHTYGLVAGVTEVINTNKENSFENGMHNDKNGFPSFLRISKSELKSNKINIINNFSDNTKGILLNHSEEKINLPIIQRQVNKISAHENKYRVRPIESGIAIGNPIYSFSGTLGGICTLKGQEGYYLISNWHVLVGLNGELNNPIIQPNSDLDGSSRNNQDNIAKLVWYRLDKYMDVALAKINDSISIKDMENTKTAKIVPAKIGMEVFKSNFKSYKKGKIINTNCTVRVDGNSYPNKYVILRNLIISEKISSPSDSGSIVKDLKSEQVVGIIIGGDNKKFSVINPLDFTMPITPTNCRNYDYSLENIEIEEFI